GVDVLASGDDHVLGPVDQVQIGQVVEIAEITRSIPAVDQGGRRHLGLVPVAEHDVRPPDHDLADLARRGVSTVGTEDADVDAHHGRAAGTNQRSVEQSLFVDL